MDSNILSMDKIVKTVKPIADKYNVAEMYLFGSYARGEATSDSDLDFLVFGGEQFKPVMIFALGEELREAFYKNVDIYEIYEVNQDSSFYRKILSELLLVT